MTRALCVCVAVFMGCLPELERSEGEHVIYEHSAEYQPCGGNLAYLDGMVPWLGEHLGVRSAEQIRYSWITEADVLRLLGEAGEKIVDRAGGVAIGYHAMAWQDPVLVHELAHSLWGTQVSAPFFQEGFAVAVEMLISGYPLFLRHPASFDASLAGELWVMMRRPALEVDYTVAGGFVLFLLARHGPDKFRQLYGSLEGSTPGELAAEFRGIYGVELAEEIEHFVAGDMTCAEYRHDLLALRCFGPEVPWAYGAWSLAGELDCDSEEVVGGAMPGEELRSFRVVSLEIPEDGDYAVELFGDPEVSATLSPCFGCGLSQPDVPLWGESGDVRTLAAGRYAVRVTGWSDEAPTYGVVVRPVAP